MLVGGCLSNHLLLKIPLVQQCNRVSIIGFQVTRPLHIMVEHSSAKLMDSCCMTKRAILGNIQLEGDSREGQYTTQEPRIA